MTVFLLSLLSKSILLYLAEFFFVYSVILYRLEFVQASKYSIYLFDKVTAIYAQKSVTQLEK